MVKTLLTRAGLDALKKKLAEIESELVELKKGKAEAYTLGGNGYHENASFEEITRQESLLEFKIDELCQKIREADIVPEKKTGATDKVVIGSKIRLGLEDGREAVFEITDPVLTDPLSGKISAESPLGKALVGKRIDDEVEYKVGERIFKARIVEII